MQNLHLLTMIMKYSDSRNFKGLLHQIPKFSTPYSVFKDFPGPGKITNFFKDFHGPVGTLVTTRFTIAELLTLTWHRSVVWTWCGRDTSGWRRGQSVGCPGTSCEHGSSSPDTHHHQLSLLSHQEICSCQKRYVSRVGNTLKLAFHFKTKVHCFVARVYSPVNKSTVNISMIRQRHMTFYGKISLCQAAATFGTESAFHEW